jgi:hypothetical protein
MVPGLNLLLSSTTKLTESMGQIGLYPSPRHANSQILVTYHHSERLKYRISINEHLYDTKPLLSGIA